MVAVSAFRADEIAVRVALLERMAVTGDPAALPAGDSHDESIVGNVFGDNGTSGDEAITTQGDAADDGGVRSDAGAPADQGGLVKAATADLGAGIGDVGQDAGGAKEDIVLNGRAGVDGDVVLNLDVVSHGDGRGDHGVLAEAAISANYRTTANMREVPDGGSLADDGTIVDDCGWVDF